MSNNVEIRAGRRARRGVMHARIRAAGPDPARACGTIDKVDGNTLTLKTRDGETQADAHRQRAVVAVVKATMADVKPGAFLGSRARCRSPTAARRRMEVHDLPRSTARHRRRSPALCTGAGQHHDQRHASAPRSAGVDGQVIDGQVQGRREEDHRAARACRFSATRSATEATSSPVRPLLLLAATKKPDGTFEAARINVGRDGIVPQ